MMNYKVFVVMDACTTLTGAEHGGGYRLWHTHFATSRNTQSMLGLIPAI
jgi:hypothetical protein